MRNRRLSGRRAVTARAAAATLLAWLTLAVIPAARSNAAAGPAFVQQASAHSLSVPSLSVTPTANLGAGDRLVVEVGTWSSGGATIRSVTDSAGDTFVELTRKVASEQTELSVWTAPVSGGAGARVTVTATPTARADVGMTVLEYSGLASATDASVMDQVATATGRTGSAGLVASGPTAPTTGSSELALGFYADSGFGDTLAGGAGYAVRSDVAPDGDVELLAEDQVVGTGATPDATAGTGASTVWLMATVVLKSASQGASAPQGQWGPLMNWPIVAVHQILMPNGKTLAFDGWQQPEPTYVWNPATASFENTINAPDSIFCSGTAELPDGRVMVIGGDGALSTGSLGIVDTSIFDPGTESWTRVADMHEARWYPDLTELPDGRFVAISGNQTSTTYADTPEIYDPVANTWTQLSSISTSQVHEEEYPFSYLLPNGNVFTIAPSADRSFELNVNPPSWNQVGGASGVVNGSSVMYLPGHILYSGGAPSVITTTNAVASAATIDLTAPNPTWQPAAPMNAARVYHTLTMLADGTVLAVGGEPTSDQNNADTGVLPAEIWNPASGTWTTVASMSVARNYHSTAVLQPDGTVLSAGGGHDENTTGQGQYNAQVYAPPYLSGGTRPTITSAPATVAYGAAVPIGTPDAATITSVNLISLGADTHQSDMDQHFVPLSFTPGTSAGTLSVQIPSSPAVAPPGNYMLFILRNGIPSVARIVNLGPAADAVVPGPPAGVSASAGNATASVSWTPPADGNSPISSYTVTPFAGGTPGSPVTVSGSATSAAVPGLVNGATYTFTVTATNGVGAGPASAPSNPVIPTASVLAAFVQQAANHAASVAALSVTPSAALGTGNRLVVEAAMWSSSGATARAVTDTAGDQFVEIAHTTAPDGTEMSVWTAPVTAGAGSRPSITVTPTSPADIGETALEYAGLSTAGDASAVDTVATATGRTGSTSATVYSGATAPVGASGEMALGFYADSGFGDALRAAGGFVARSDVSPTGDVELLAEDQSESAGATPDAGAATGPYTPWAMTTAVFRTATTAPPPTAGFVQQKAAHTSNSASLSVTPAAPLRTGDRLVVEAGTWSSSGATAKSVTDSAGDPFVELTRVRASDGTELSVWSAPVTTGAATAPTVTVTPTARADLGMVMAEYSGLSPATGTSVMDTSATATGTTGGAATVVRTGPTAPTGSANELVLGIYADSGFGDALGGGAGFTVRSDLAPEPDMEMLFEDQVAAAGATPAAGVATGPQTVWLMATVVLKL